VNGARSSDPILLAVEAVADSLLRVTIARRFGVLDIPFWLDCISEGHNESHILHRTLPVKPWVSMIYYLSSCSPPIY